MTALVFIIVLTLAWLHYATAGVMFTAGLTIYVVAFIATLGTASFVALLSQNTRSLIGAAILILNFAGSHYAWNYAEDPILFQAAMDIATATWFIVSGNTRWELAIGGLYLASVLSAALANFGLIHGYLDRPRVFIAFSYPDIAALLGHAASITLGAGAGDAGRRYRDTLQARPLVFAYRRNALARMAALAKGTQRS